MSSKVSKLASAYRQHLTVPWQPGLAAIQRVIFAVYDKADELRLRANVEEFALATQQAGKSVAADGRDQRLSRMDVRTGIPRCIFRVPRRPGGLPDRRADRIHRRPDRQTQGRISAEAGPNTVVAVLGVGTLFGLARVSSLVEGIKEAVEGRLLVFFPGEHHPENHTYRLLDARDGWNYLAVPLLAQD
jgi:hypothetical protein